MNFSMTAAALLSGLVNASITEQDFNARFNGDYLAPQTVFLTNKEDEESGFVLKAESGNLYTFSLSTAWQETDLSAFKSELSVYIVPQVKQLEAVGAVGDLDKEIIQLLTCWNDWTEQLYDVTCLITTFRKYATSDYRTEIQKWHFNSPTFPRVTADKQYIWEWSKFQGCLDQP